MEAETSCTVCMYVHRYTKSMTEHTHPEGREEERRRILSFVLDISTETKHLQRQHNDEAPVKALHCTRPGSPTGPINMTTGRVMQKMDCMINLFKVSASHATLTH